MYSSINVLLEKPTKKTVHFYLIGCYRFHFYHMCFYTSLTAPLYRMFHLKENTLISLNMCISALVLRLR